MRALCTARSATHSGAKRSDHSVLLPVVEKATAAVRFVFALALALALALGLGFGWGFGLDFGGSARRRTAGRCTNDEFKNNNQYKIEIY